MIRRRLIILLFVPLALLGAGLLAQGWLMSSDAGSRWILTRASQNLEGELSVSGVEGNLGAGLRLTGVRFVQGGLELEASSLQAVVGFSLLPLEVEIKSLHAQGLTIWRRDNEADPGRSAGSVEDMLVGLRPPLAIDVHTAQLEDLELRGVGGEVQVYVDSVSAAGKIKDQFDLSELRVVTPWLDLNLQGHINLEPPFDHQLTAGGHVMNAVDTGVQDAGFDFSLAAEGDRLETRLVLANKSRDMEIAGQVSSPFSNALLDLHVGAGHPVKVYEAADTAILLADLTGGLEGSPTDYKLNLQATMEATGLPPVRLELAGQGGMETLVITSLDADSDFLVASTSGTIFWAGPRVIELDVDAQRVDPGFWVSDWPREHYVHGGVSIAYGDAVIDMQKMYAKVAGTEMAIEGQGKLDPNAGVVDARLSWQKLGWPIEMQDQSFSSESAGLKVSGSPSDWQIEGKLEFDTRTYPGGNFELHGGGNSESAEFAIVRGEALGGTLAGEARLDWQDAFKWNADLDVKQVNLGDLFSDWPARLDAKMNIFQDTGTDSFTLQFQQLSGDFRGQNLDGSGGLSFDKSGIRFSHVRLQSGASAISLHGDLEDASGLEFAVDVRKSGWMADYLGGEITGSGRIALAGPQPVLEIGLEAHDLHWGEAQIENVLITPVADAPGDQFGLKLQADSFEYGGNQLDQITAVLSGNRHRQVLSISMEEAGYTLDARLDGTTSGLDKLEDTDWSGHLARFDLATGQQAILGLEQAAPLSISAKEISLGQTCLSVEDSGGICLASRWQPGNYLDVTGNLSELWLGATQLLHEHGLDFTQTLDGDFRWVHESGKYPSGRAGISISAGQFGDRLEESGRIKTAKGFFGFEMDNGNLTTGVLDIPFPGIGKIDLDYAVSGLALDGTGKINGSVHVGLDDISVLKGLLPGMEHLSGTLDTDLQITGTTSDPKLSGGVSLHDATADFSYLYTQLREVQLEGSFSGDDRALLLGEFKAGDGHGEIRLEADYSDWASPRVGMSLTGSSLRLLNTPELRLDTDADLHLGWELGEWAVDGNILVKQARLAPVTSIVSQVSESEDIRIVAGSLPYATESRTSEPFRITGQLEISLGEKVEIYTEQAKLNLNGSVMLAWSGDLIPIADGNIHVDGTLSVFGPLLHVERGRVRFPKIPADNAILDIQAERDVFGNTQIRSAGVSITGSAKRPLTKAYTRPYTNEDRAWALLITGSDLDYGQGVGAFEVGAYIAPKLYLSYGVSLFDDNNVIGARYDLKKGFGVKATSGERESGVDISYTVER